MAAAAERGDEITLAGASPVVRSRQAGMAASTLLSVQGKNTLGVGNDRVLTVTKKKTAGGVATVVGEVLIPAGEVRALGPVLLSLDAADETAEFVLDAAGAWALDAVWLDRSV